LSDDVDFTIDTAGMSKKENCGGARFNSEAAEQKGKNLERSTPYWEETAVTSRANRL
jgi:hypothetical protein